SLEDAMDPAPSPAAPEPEAPGLLTGLARNLTGGLAVAALLRRWPTRFSVGFDQVAALLAVNLAVWAGLDRPHARPHAEFLADGLFGWGCYVLLGFIGCALIARAESRAAPTRALLTVALSVAPFVLTAFWLAGDFTWVAQWPLPARALAAIYLALLAVRGLGAAFGPVRLAPALLAVALALASPWVLVLLDFDTSFFVAPEVEEAAQDEDDPATTEALLYEQPAHIA